MINNPLPDLAIRRFEPDRTLVLPGHGVHYQTEIVNQGSAAVDRVEVSFGSGRRDRERYLLEGLAPGESMMVRFGPVSGNFPGAYTYRIDLDPDNKTRESREDNNSARESFSVVDTRPPGPPMPPPRPPR
jgi:subtilase family serine protease